MYDILCLPYKHEPKETSNTVQKPKRKGVMRNQNTEEYVKHCFPNANNKKIKCKLKILMRFTGTEGRRCKSLRRFFLLCVLL